ncbi:MAG: hypothetical protein IJ018_03440 [Bacilli bacterium]|nr:hypothetical protein [Bacilli bacterium]
MLDSLTNSDIIILGVLISVILIVGIICIILTIKSGNNKSKVRYEEEVVEPKGEPDIHIALATENIPALPEKEEYVLPEVKVEHEEIVSNPIEEEVVMPVREEKSMKLEEVSSLLEQANKELEEHFDLNDLDTSLEIPEVPDKRNSTNIEDVLKAMQIDLEKQKYEKIDRYEEEQEENAVISYQELLDRKMALNEINADNEPLEEVRQVELEDIEEEPVSYLDRLAKYENMSLEPSYEWKTDDRQFASSEFISPIFGRQDSSKIEYPTVKKKIETKETVTTTVHTGEDALEQTADFLNTLKEFRKNL